MNNVLFKLQQILLRVTEGLGSLLGTHAGLLALTIVSVIIGALFAIVYGKVSPQATIARAKRNISTSFIEAALFRANPVVSLKAQLMVLPYSVWYFLLSIPALVILALPFVLLAGHLNLLFGSIVSTEPRDVIVKVQLDDPRLVYRTEATGNAALEVSALVRAPAAQQVILRTKVRPGSPELALRVGDKSAALPVARAGNTIKPQVIAGSFWEMLLYPGITHFKLPPGVSRIEVQWPPRSYAALGLSLSWFVVFLVISILAGFLTSRICRIEI